MDTLSYKTVSVNKEHANKNGMSLTLKDRS